MLLLPWWLLYVTFLSDIDNDSILMGLLFPLAMSLLKDKFSVCGKQVLLHDAKETSKNSPPEHGVKTDWRNLRSPSMTRATVHIFSVSLLKLKKTSFFKRMSFAFVQFFWVWCVSSMAFTLLYSVWHLLVNWLFFLLKNEGCLSSFFNNLMDTL